jgi:hypothetical protein
LLLKVKLLVITVTVAESLTVFRREEGGREGQPDGGNSLSFPGKWILLKQNLMNFNEKIIMTHLNSEFQNKHSEIWRKSCTHL